MTSRRSKALGVCLLFLLAGPALAADPPPLFGRYLPLHPGLYVDSSYGHDPRDRSYDQGGRERDTAAPQAGGRTSFPEVSLTTRLTWHVPLFEGEGIPFLSSRTHLARLTLRYRQTKTKGALADFIADTADDEDTDADDLRNNGSGLGDPSFEFGSFLLGSPVAATRGGERPPYSLLALAGFTMPAGIYDRDAPVSAGNNTASVHLQLGGHWQPRPGTVLEAGFLYRDYFQNYDAAFGALDPTNQGDDRVFDLSLSQRLWRGLHLSVYGLDRRGGSNLYENPRFSPNRPESSSPLADSQPTPGSYRDGGTALREAGAGLQWFAGQRLLLGLHYSQPLSGRSGQFQLPYSERTPAGCTPGGTGCMFSDGGTVLVDGTGAARSYASPRLTVSLAYQFGLGDFYSCAGCKR